MCCLRNRRQSCGRKWRRTDFIDHELQIYLCKAKGDDVFEGKMRRKFFFQIFSISRADSKSDHCTNVTKNSRGHFLFHLFDVLVSDREVQFVFSCLRENVGKRFVSKVLELVDEEIEVWQSFQNTIRRIGA